MRNDIETGSLACILKHELQHLREHWVLFLLFGILLVLGGTAAIVIPAATIGTTFAVAVFLGILLMIGGVLTIVSSFWIGKWSGFLIHLLVGILYTAAGFVMTENPIITATAMTVFIAVSFVVLGLFRSIGTLTLHHPQWGWSLLNGVITMLAGIIIFRRLPFDALWVVGLLVGLEMLFNGWTWIMTAIALRRIPKEMT